MSRRSSLWVCGALIMVPLLLLSVPCTAQDADPLLNTVFQDHVVLQRSEPIPVWGTAAPTDTVQVLLAGATATAVAGPDGHWSARLPARAAGGPHRLVVRAASGRVQTLDDVLVGDVYLCSGQSNMELPVHRTLNAPAEIDAAANDRIRMLTVPHARSAVPQETLPDGATWETAAPETVQDWSATCYYFARALQRHEDVPLGLLDSSWGGTSITAWMTDDALTAAGDYGDDLSLLNRYADDRQGAQQAYGHRWERWWRSAVGPPNGEAPWQPHTGAAWSAAPDELGNWREWDAPVPAEASMLWYRATVDLSAEQARQDAVLSLGPVNQVDQTWVNGAVVGTTVDRGARRAYTIPASQLHEGENAIVVHVYSSWGPGGLLGPSPSLLTTATGREVPLDDWQYEPVSGEVEAPPAPPWHPTGGLTMLHNAMLAPLHPYNLRGILWYQGESDVDKGRAYLDLLRGLKKQWRGAFGDEVPVLVVQLANFGPQPATPTESGWAEVRDAQRRATQDDPHADLAVTVDVGSPDDIHPANKQAVGRRLARAGRHVVYGADVSPSGPMPRRATRSGDGVTVQFNGVEDSLVAYGHSAPIGFELCGPAPGSCRYADATLRDRRVRLRAENLEAATRVRYCWADSPVCTLYDGARLPATPFEVTISGDDPK